MPCLHRRPTTTHPSAQPLTARPLASTHCPAVRRRINYFDYYTRWSAEEQALYSFGLVCGTAAWAAALLATLWDLLASWQQAQQGDIPLTAALLSGDHLLPMTREPSASCNSSSVNINALLAWPQEEASPRSRRKAGGGCADSLSAMLPALLRVRPT